MDDERPSEESPEAGREDGEESPPLQDLVDRIRGNDAGVDPLGQGVTGDTPSGSADEFDEESSELIDIETVWKSIESDWPDAVGSTGFEAGDAEHVVPKRRYCEQCEYFGEPPEVRCTHDGTTIVEFVGTDDVRVRNCPVVAERKALGQFQRDEIHRSTSE